MRNKVPRIKELRTNEDKILGLSETYQRWLTLDPLHRDCWSQNTVESETAGSAEIKVKTKRERERK